MFKLVTVLSLAVAVSAQGVGKLKEEVHPKVTWSRNGQTVNGAVVVDANWRWVHNANGQNCYTGNKWDSGSCPDDATCAKNCFLDGADYSGTYGVTTSGNSVHLGFVTNGGQKNVGSRLYLMASEDKYEMFKLVNQEFTFDVDVSKLPCGINGALYFVAMDAEGNKKGSNTAGAKYGTGYCDGQCPKDIKFINGIANSEGWKGTNENSGNGNHGACCAEMDIWEANSMATAFTPHPCSNNAYHMCTGDACGGGTSKDRYAGTCDPDGCDFNSYRQGDKNFYGPGKKVDTSKPFTVVTQFIGNPLHEIKRFYVQGGKVIENSQSTVNGNKGNSITQEFCASQKKAFGDKDAFTQHGGLAQMGKALQQGMVLVLSLWDDTAVDMLWLDSNYPKDKSPSTPGVARGPCAGNTGDPKETEDKYPSAYVVYSNIKVGAINSTFKH